MSKHVQCKLRRAPDWFQTAWIPEKHAMKGNVIGIKNENGHWEEGWEVIEVYDKLDSDYVMERERDFKRTRKASDI
jgi:hypothetical protein